MDGPWNDYQSDTAVAESPWEEYKRKPWDDYKPTETPAKDSQADAKLQSYGVDTAAPEDSFDPSKVPEPIEKTAKAVTTEALGLVPRSAEAVGGLLTPVGGAAREVKNTYGMVKDWIDGAPIDDAVKKNLPESQISAEADKTPPGSQERYNAAAHMLTQLGMAVAIGKQLGQPQIHGNVLRDEEIARQNLPQEQLPGVQDQPATGATKVPEMQSGLQQSLEEMPQADQRTAEEIQREKLRLSLSAKGETSKEALRSLRESELANAPRGLQQTSGSELDVSNVSFSLPQEPVSTKNAAVEAARKERGYDPIEKQASRDWGTVWDEANAEVAKDPSKPQRLAEELANKPRPIEDKENAILMRRLIDVRKEHDAAIEEVNNSTDEVSLAEAQIRLGAAREDYHIADQAATHAGTKLGQGLNARKMMALEDYSLAKMEATKRAANGGKPLNQSQLREVQDLQTKMAELEGKLSKYETARKFNDLAKEARQEARRMRQEGKLRSNQEFLERRATEARERLKDVVCQV